MGSLTEEFKRRLRLEVDSGDIRQRTMDTKLECLNQIQKVWEEVFTTGAINPANYDWGGDQTHRRPATYTLFFQVRLSSLTPNKLQEWRAAMCQAYSPSRINGAMSVFRELLKLGVEKGMLFQNHDLSSKLSYVRPGKTKLNHLPTASKFKALVAEIYDRAAKGETVFGKGLNDAGQLFEFLAYTGSRIKAANHVTWEYVDWPHNKLTFEVTKRDAYSIPLFPPLKELLERMKTAAGGDPHGPLFKVKNIKRVLHSACKAVGTPLLTHHDLRHYFATRCMENPSIDIPTISRWLGHKDGGALAMEGLRPFEGRAQPEAGHAGKIRLNDRFPGGSHAGPNLPRTPIWTAPVTAIARLRENRCETSLLFSGNKPK